MQSVKQKVPWLISMLMLAYLVFSTEGVGYFTGYNTYFLHDLNIFRIIVFIARQYYMNQNHVADCKTEILLTW